MYLLRFRVCRMRGGRDRRSETAQRRRWIIREKRLGERGGKVALNGSAELHCSQAIQTEQRKRKLQEDQLKALEKTLVDRLSTMLRHISQARIRTKAAAWLIELKLQKPGAEAVSR